MYSCVYFYAFYSVSSLVYLSIRYSNYIFISCVPWLKAEMSTDEENMACISN